MNSVIYLRGIKYVHMNSILEFMYLGTTTINTSNIEEFYYVAKDLEMVEICKNLLNSHGFLSANSTNDTKEEAIQDSLSQELEFGKDQDINTVDEMTKNSEEEQLQQQPLENFNENIVMNSSLNKDQDDTKSLEVQDNMYHCEQCDLKTRHKTT